MGILCELLRWGLSTQGNREVLAVTLPYLAPNSLVSVSPEAEEEEEEEVRYLQKCILRQVRHLEMVRPRDRT